MKKAFTLAELLIALTVVGVVAVLTVPHVMKNTFTKANIAVLQQTYSQFADTIPAAMLEMRIRSLEDMDLPLVSDTETQAHAFMKKYFDVTKDCGSTQTGCFADIYKDINATSRENFASSADTFFILANGAAVGLESNIRGYFFIDVNNIEPPNILGRDLFVAYITDKGELTASSDDVLENGDEITSLSEDCKTFSGYWVTCVDYLMQNNWKMDY